MKTKPPIGGRNHLTIKEAAIQPTEKPENKESNIVVDIDNICSYFSNLALIFVAFLISF